MIHLQMQPDGTFTMTIKITPENGLLPNDPLPHRLSAYLENKFFERAMDLLYYQGPIRRPRIDGFWESERLLYAYETFSEYFPVKVLYKHRHVLWLIKRNPSKAQDVSEKYDISCLAGEREYLNHMLKEALEVYLSSEDDSLEITGIDELKEYVRLLSN